MMRLLCLIAAAGLASADIQISRTVDSESVGSGTVSFGGSPTCASKDTYGDNNCDFKWGGKYTADIDVTLTNDVTTGATFAVDAKLDGLIPFKFSCPACGGSCTITIPIVKKTVSFDLPACPIKAGPFKQSIPIVLPASSPVPISASFSATVTAADATGKQVVHATATGKVSPSAEQLAAAATPSVEKSALLSVWEAFKAEHRRNYTIEEEPYHYAAFLHSIAQRAAFRENDDKLV